eukprot:scaffold2450_cov128-Isochrysis_galbana.AAC.6
MWDDSGTHPTAPSSHGYLIVSNGYLLSPWGCSGGGRCSDGDGACREACSRHRMPSLLGPVTEVT